MAVKLVFLGKLADLAGASERDVPAPLDWQALPMISMRVVPARGGLVRTFQTRFTFDDETGLPRLMRGAYVLGTSPNAWRSNIDLQDLGPDTPASLVSVLLSMEPEGGA